LTTLSWVSNGTWDFSHDDQVVQLTGGGYCGWTCHIPQKQGVLLFFLCQPLLDFLLWHPWRPKLTCDVVAMAIKKDFTQNQAWQTS